MTDPRSGQHNATMLDAADTTMQPTVVVNPSAVPDITNTIVRDVAIVAAAFPILVKLIGARDINGILHWLQSSDGATVLAIVIPIGLTWWRTMRAKAKKAVLVEVARPSPVAIVTEPTPPPAAA